MADKHNVTNTPSKAPVVGKNSPHPKVVVKESESDYLTLIDNLNESVVVVCDGKICFINRRTTELSGYTNEELGSNSYDEFIYPDDRKVVTERYERALRGEHPGKFIFRAFSKKGNLNWIESNVVSSIWQGKPATLSFATFITERKLAEEQLLTYQKELRSLASQLSLAEERERRRIAAEVHDRVSQTLAVVSMKLGNLQEAASSNGLAKSLSDIRGLVKQLSQETRSLTFELSSPLLYQVGLEAALEHLAQQMQKEYGIEFCFEDDGKPKPLNNDVSVLVFQIVRELLINITKHANAHHAKIRVCKYVNEMQILVEDDGIGFDVALISAKKRMIKGYGLFAVRERLNYIGGNIKFQSEIGRGTSVTIAIPLKHD